MKNLPAVLAILLAVPAFAKTCQSATDSKVTKNEFGETAGQKWTNHNENGEPSTLCWTWGEKTEWVTRPIAPPPDGLAKKNYDAYSKQYQEYLNSLTRLVPIKLKTVRFSVTWVEHHTLLPDETKSFTTDELPPTKDGWYGANGWYFAIKDDGKALAVVDGKDWQRQIQTQAPLLK